MSIMYVQVVMTKPQNAQKKYAGIPRTQKSTVSNAISQLTPFLLDVKNLIILFLGLNGHLDRHEVPLVIWTYLRLYYSKTATINRYP